MAVKTRNSSKNASKSNNTNKVLKKSKAIKKNKENHDNDSKSTSQEKKVESNKIKKSISFGDTTITSITESCAGTGNNNSVCNEIINAFEKKYQREQKPTFNYPLKGILKNKKKSSEESGANFIDENLTRCLSDVSKILDTINSRSEEEKEKYEVVLMKIKAFVNDQFTTLLMDCNNEKSMESLCNILSSFCVFALKNYSY
ncbi:Hypothetical protein SRAE_X000122400 [Strongyloides ratti]|uniref:Uncharacterized protein n=1 Tax=Strongyloides ratti TaxID=34506 RepID=A0A090MN45_STRRB|nr:Hypothetical protein SRAE_X000122400 [Strongyloides ratti]CEF59476.1 Hypothetical protein SRAE_X000122400 [Strongyloides ratti]